MPSFGRKTMAALAKELSENTSLAELDLDGYASIGFNPSAALGVLAEPLCKHRCIRRLVLTRCDLDDGACNCLKTILVGNGSLKTINLQNNRITEIGAGLIADGLASNRCLTKLDLSNNPLGAMGADVRQRFIDAFGTNFTLTEISWVVKNDRNNWLKSLADLQRRNSTIARRLANCESICDLLPDSLRESPPEYLRPRYIAQPLSEQSAMDAGYKLMVTKLSGAEVLGASFDQDATVLDVKQVIQTTTKIPKEQQRLLWDCTELADKHTLRDVGLPLNSTTMLTLLSDDPIEKLASQLMESWTKKSFEHEFMITKIGKLAKGSAHPSAMAALAAVPKDSPWTNQAVHSLGQVAKGTADVDAVALLAEMLRTGPCKTAAIQSIGLACSNDSVPLAVEALARAVAQDPDEYVRELAVFWIGKVAVNGDATATSCLEAAVDHRVSGSRVAYTARKSLSEFQGEPWISPKLDSKSWLASLGFQGKPWSRG